MFPTSTCMHVCFALTHPTAIQSCSVEPVPERETMRRFEGKNVVESIVR